MDHHGYEALSVEVVGGIATVTIDHPADQLVRPAALRRDVPAVRRAGRWTRTCASWCSARRIREFFIAHFDVSVIQTIPTDLPAPTELNEFHQMGEAFRTMPKATIAVIEGRVGGGGSELTLSCDMRFAALPSGGSAGATFNQPEVALGILPGGSGTVRLSRLIGRSRTARGHPRLRRHRCRDRRGLGLGESRAACRRTVAVRRPARSANRAFPPHAVAAAKARGASRREGRRGRSARRGSRLQHHPRAPIHVAALQRFLDLGGQTRAGELRLGDLAAELAP